MGLDGNSLFEQTVKQHPSVSRSPSIEPESEFVQIEVQHISGNSTLMDSQEPAFQQRSDPMDPGEHNVGSLVPFPVQDGWAVSVSELFDPIITPPAVRNELAPRGNVPAYESEQALSGRISDSFQPYTAYPLVADLCGHDHQGFSRVAPSVPSRSASHHGVIDLNLAAQLFSTGSDHRTAQLVEAGPRSLITPQAQRPLQPEGADTALLVCDQPDRTKPDPQRQFAPFEYSPSCDRNIRPAASTTQQSSSTVPGLPMPATWTAEPLGPSQLSEIVATSLFCPKPVFEFEQAPWISFPHQAIL